jgi:hypothetical protein
MADVGKELAAKAASRGPNPQERMQGQKGSLKTPGPGRFIHNASGASGPKEGPNKAVKGMIRKSFAISGKEGMDR